MGTILRGSGEEGIGRRAIGLTLPTDWTPDRLDLRVYVTDGTGLVLRAVASGSRDGAAGEPVEVEPGESVVDVVVPLPDLDDAATVQVELSGDCVSPTLLSARLSQDLPASETVHRTLEGPLEDLRPAIGLGVGAELVAPLDARGSVTIRAAVRGADEGGGRVRIALVDGGVELAHVEAEASAEWNEVGLQSTDASTASKLVATHVGGGPIWIAEDRFDAASDRPRTVVLITSDTHRGDHVGLGGADAPVVTPHLEALAARGIAFTNCFSPTNVTTPSHVTLMTGLPLRDTRVVTNQSALKDGATTLAETFRAAGYRTFAATSVLHLHPDHCGLRQGFDRYDAPKNGRRGGRQTVDRLSSWIPDAAGSPLFVWLHVYDAHAPYAERPEKLSRLYPEGVDPRDPTGTLGIDDVAVRPWIRNAGYTDRAFVDALYAANVEVVDDLVGRILSHERLRDGVVAFTADHGESLGTEGIFWDHSRLNRDTMHIPLVLAFPGVEPARTAAPVEMQDLGRTLLDLAGIDTTFPGRDLRWVLEDPGAARPRYALGFNGWSASIESEGWLLTLQIRSYPQPFGLRNWEHGETELFDLASDPLAERNVLDENFDRARSMRRALVSWLRLERGPGLAADAPLDDRQRATLSELGYGGQGEGVDADPWWRPDENAAWNRRFK